MSAQLSLLDVVARAVPALPWAEGDNIPWDDPEFSERMLVEHLSQEHDLASRRAGIVARHVDWLHRQVLGGRPGRILDLACGPGLYLHGLARLGHAGVGIDFGPASIRHARAIAAEHGLDCTFRQEDLRRADLGHGFDLVMMIYGQLNVFRRQEALDLVRRAHAALEPGGRLVLELESLEALRGDGRAAASWTGARQGLFSARPHLLLHERFWDEQRRCRTERWHVVDAETGGVVRYALTNEAYTRQEISTLLAGSGFGEIAHLPALPGSQDQGLFFAMVSRRNA